MCIWPLQSIFVRVPGIPASWLIAIKGLAGPMLLPERCGAFCSNLSGAPELKVPTDGCKIRRGNAAIPAAVPSQLLALLLPGGAQRRDGLSRAGDAVHFPAKCRFLSRDSAETSPSPARFLPEENLLSSCSKPQFRSAPCGRFSPPGASEGAPRTRGTALFSGQWMRW